MFTNNVILLTISVQFVLCYTNKQFTIMRTDLISDFQCDVYNSRPLKELKENLINLKDWQITQRTIDVQNYSFATIKPFVPILIDPIDTFDGVIEQVMYGEPRGPNDKKIKYTEQLKNSAVDMMAHLPSGAEMRAEMFHNKSSVHLPFTEYLHRGHAYLKISRDHMQTAVDAFAIFLAGSIEDVMRLPPAYVLQSARTIAMMKIAREKLAATWLVVKGSTPTNEVTYETLEKFRPLFKYVNAKEMARLDLLDKNILSFIGTHPDLSRHQVGVVASKYIQLNKNWTQARYLNVMNNLLCGVPMMVMRRVPKPTYLQLTHQLFYHIRACDPLQRKFYLQMMTRTQALGKSYSWSARDVSRLGLLLAEVDGPSLGAINPEAMTGITSQVMLQMPTEILLYLTEIQLRYIEPKALNILAKKISNYRSQRFTNSGYDLSVYTLTVILMSFILRSIV